MFFSCQAASISSAPQTSVQSFVDNIDWHSMQGKRVSYIEKNLMAVNQELHIVLIAMLTSAFEEITPVFLGQRNSSDPTPMLLRLTHLPDNPALVVCQFASALWSCEHACTTLLCVSRGCSTPAGLLSADPKAVALIRRTLGKTAVGAHAKWIFKYLQAPWWIAGLVNPKLGEVEKQELRRRFMRLCSKCLDLGFLRSLRRRIVRSSDLELPKWVEVLALWVFLIDGDTHDMELWNGWMKAHNANLSTFELAAARLVNAQAMASMPSVVDDSSQTADGDDDATQRKRSRAQISAEKSAIQVFHKHCVRRDKGSQTPFNPVSKEYWQEVKNEFGGLTAETKQDFMDLAVAQQDALYSGQFAPPPVEQPADVASHGPGRQLRIVAVGEGDKRVVVAVAVRVVGVGVVVVVVVAAAAAVVIVVAVAAAVVVVVVVVATAPAYPTRAITRVHPSARPALNL